MNGMAVPSAASGLWNWCFDAPLEPAAVRAALADALRRPVTGLDPDPDPDAVLCDVWSADGDFPTAVDCYLAPADAEELVAAQALAAGLGASCLLPDESVDPSKHLLVAPDGRVRRVHVDVTETDTGTRWTNVRPCTGVDIWCQSGPGGGSGTRYPEKGRKPAAA
jgi:hypothetical protein